MILVSWEMLWIHEIISLLEKAFEARFGSRIVWILCKTSIPVKSWILPLKELLGVVSSVEELFILERHLLGQDFPL